MMVFVINRKYQYLLLYLSTLHLCEFFSQECYIIFEVPINYFQHMVKNLPLNPLTPRSDQKVTSSLNIYILYSKQVMRYSN